MFPNHGIPTSPTPFSLPNTSTQQNQLLSLSSPNNKGYVLCTTPCPDTSSPRQEYLCTIVCNSDSTLITEISRFRIPFPNASIIGICNVIFCLLEYRIIRKVCSFPSNPTYYLLPCRIIYLWNPSIRKFKEVSICSLV